MGDHRLRLLIRWRQAIQGAGGVPERLGRARAAAAVARLQFAKRGRDAFGPPFALLQALAFGSQHRLLALLGRQRAQLLDCVAQEFLVARRRGDLRAGLGQRPLGSAPAAPGLATGHALNLQPTEGVEQPGMGGGIGEADLVMLALHLNELAGEAAQQADGDRLVIDEGPAAAIGLDHAAQDQRIFNSDALFGQGGEDRMAGGRGEGGGNRALRLPGPNQTGFRPEAAGQAQAIEQDRFAGAGLAGQHGQAGSKSEVQPFDQDHVADRERDQHARIRTASHRRGGRSRADPQAPGRRRRQAGRSCPGTRGCPGSYSRGPKRSCGLPR